MKKILDVNNCIEMTTQSDSTLCAILSTNEKAYSWIMNHYIFIWQRESIQHKGKMTTSIMPLTNGFNLAEDCPYIQQIRFDCNEIKSKYGSLVDLVINMINNNWYMVCMLDQFYINQRSHYIHPNFIYGYDDVKKKFFIQDHFDHGKLSQLEVEFDKVEKGFSDLDFLQQKYKSAFNVTAVRLKDENEIKEIYEAIGPDTKKFKDELLFSLSDMYNRLPIHLGQKGLSSQLPYTENGYYGIGIYDGMAQIIDYQIENYRELDYRDFTTLENINNLMVTRINYLNERHVINNSEVQCIFEELAKECRKCLFMSIKYNMTKKEKIKYSLIDNLVSMGEKAKIGYENLINSITDNSASYKYIFLDFIY